MYIKHLLEKLLDLIFPIPESRKTLLRELSTITPEKLLEVAAATSLPEEDMRAALNYQHPLVREIIWQLKYKNQKRFANLLAHCLYPDLIEELSEQKLFENFTNPLLIPIPLSKKRLRERGFNQCELIAKEMSLIDGNKNFTFDTSVLYRIKDNEHQARLKDRKSRIENSKQAFAVFERAKIERRNVILLDDIITSGATIRSAKKVLKEAGARKILMISVAH